ncbi:chemotaxis protein CheW [Candidatus Methylospira mobilis]|uniref:chemotaxis protein CheW n=1 Tax=Candidatus Methylospira mobilis TaxID=1808979 RepID=UPI0028EB126A|nr:chemotaxis protein CheW [Candidatus Methylospira mobilis]WNV06642.1 chemotaxis protein CheW [Candidatus Methylospira mobilis]
MQYKGIEVDDNIGGLISHMGHVDEYRENLQTLQTIWDNLSLLGHLSGTGTDMTGTRQAFHRLTGSLLNQLGNETLKKTMLSMQARAQVAIDIMVRNLFERTADIGFLAMDDEVRNFLLQDVSSVVAEARRKRMQSRFRDYVLKYTVYSNVILLDTEGRLLVQLDDGNLVTHSSDPLIAESLATENAYVEVFRHSDLQPDIAVSLIYAYRVVEKNCGKALGVLCLCFKFQDEAEKIFSNLIGAHYWSAITLLNDQGKVIASSDAQYVAIGSRLKTTQDSNGSRIFFAGREYIASTRPTQGYQDYMGPGWFGHVMMPLEHAFDSDAAFRFDDIDADLLDAMTTNPELFCEAIRDIPLQAGNIQRDLNRSVWNGHVRQQSDRTALNPAFSKVLLWEISNTGLKTQQVFDRSIGNLHQTVVSSILQDNQFKAALAIDIMDRNLYERANDCRWWALTPNFQSALTSAEIDQQTQKSITQTLTDINALYTVYDNLLLYSKRGTVVAVSNPDYHAMVGQDIAEEWVQRALSLTDAQKYAVSAFSGTPLYRNRPTYIYAAAVRVASADAKIVGGIGIVFDSEPQFSAMLNDALPRNERGEIPAGCFGLFADRQKTVIASTSSAFPPGSRVTLDDDFFALRNRQGASRLCRFNGWYYAVGATMSGGYREYKRADDCYRNDVVALIFTPLGEIPEQKQSIRQYHVRNLRHADNTAEASARKEIATFYVDNQWLGLESRFVIEAIDDKGFTLLPDQGKQGHGCILFHDKVIPVIELWSLMGYSGPPSSHKNGQIIVLKHDSDKQESCFGIRVDELGEIPEIPLNRIVPISALMTSGNRLAESIVRSPDNEAVQNLLIVISMDRLRGLMGNGAQASCS